jgi:hypothetical protein
VENSEKSMHTLWIKEQIIHNLNFSHFLFFLVQQDLMGLMRIRIIKKSLFRAIEKVFHLSTEL